MERCPSCDSEFSTEMGVKVHHVKVHGESIAKRKKQCQNCGQTYEIVAWKDNSNNGQQYCSRDCMYEDAMLSGEDHPQWNGGKPTFECDYCGDEFQRQPDKRKNRNYGRFCSRECYGKWMHENNDPKDTNFWKGGVAFPGYYGRDWSIQRKKALERDDYKCQKCGATDTLHVHHKTPVRKYVRSDDTALSDAHQLENLITYCASCHAKVEQNLS